MSVIMLSGNAGGSGLTMSVIMLSGNVEGSGHTMFVIDQILQSYLTT
jgi:hypothetical protein